MNEIERSLMNYYDALRLPENVEIVSIEASCPQCNHEYITTVNMPQLASLRATVLEQADQLRKAEWLIGRIFEMADNGTSSIDIDPSSPLWQIEADTRAWIERGATSPEASPTPEPHT